MDRLYTSAIFLAALGSGVTGGLIFAFSNLFMPALGRIPAAGGIAAMQTVNLAVENPLFFLFFFGTPILCIIVAVLALMRLGEPASFLVLAGSLVYVVGVFVVTVVFNVPMNDALAAMDAQNPSTAEYWLTYLDRWTAWNHVRAVAAIAASASFMFAMFSR